MLLKYNGDQISYDPSGNLLNYYNGFSFTWTGRQPTGAINGSDTYSFTYDDNGMRTSKTKDGVKPLITLAERQ